MGSWSELDANYPPGALTPAAALIVALGMAEGAGSVYAEGGRPAAWVPRALGLSAELLARAEPHLRAADPAAFLAEARERLAMQQRLALLANVLDRAAPGGHAFVERLRCGLGVPDDLLAPIRQALALKNDLGLFPQ